jgi:hypothetical protein
MRLNIPYFPLDRSRYQVEMYNPSVSFDRWCYQLQCHLDIFKTIINETNGQRQRMQSLHSDYASPTKTPNSRPTRPNLTITHKTHTLRHTTHTTETKHPPHTPTKQRQCTCLQYNLLDYTHNNTSHETREGSCRWSLHIDFLYSCNHSVHPI